MWLIYTAIHKVLDYQEMSLLSPLRSLHWMNRSGLVSSMFLKRPINVLQFSRPFAALCVGWGVEKNPLTGLTMVSFIFCSEDVYESHVCLCCGNTFVWMMWEMHMQGVLSRYGLKAIQSISGCWYHCLHYTNTYSLSWNPSCSGYVQACVT